MKRYFFVPMFAMGVLLTGLGFSPIATAQSEQGDLIESRDKIAFEEEEIIGGESDPAVEERNIRQEFKGIDLSPQEFEQVRQARRKLHAEMTEVMKQNDASEAETGSRRKSASIIFNFTNTIHEILTPDEFLIWQRNLEEKSQSTPEKDN